MRYQRTKSKCDTCPLRSNTRVWGVGPKDAKLALFGEAPGKDEDREGFPFVGAAGHTLDWGLRGARVNRKELWISNAISCRPPANKFNSAQGENAQIACRGGFDAELRVLEDRGVRCILVFGGNAASYFGIEGKMEDIRGSVYKHRSMYVIPTYHPAFLNYMGYYKPDSRVDVASVWMADIRKGYDIAHGGWEPPRENFNLFPKIKDVEEFVTAAVKGERLVAVDIETTSLHPDWAELICIGLGTDAENVLCVPYLKQGGFSYWPKSQERKVTQLLNKLFKKCPLLFQNALFDVKILRRLGFEITYRNVAHDVMLLHHAIQPELPHNLGFIVSMHGSTPYWKGEVLRGERKGLELDDRTYRTYNCRDVSVLHQVLPSLVEDAMETETYRIYQQESLPLLVPVGRMNERGVKFSKGALTKFKNEVEQRTYRLAGELYQQAALPRAFNLRSSAHLRYFLLGQRLEKFKNLDKTLGDFEIKEQKKYLCQNESCKKKTFWSADDSTCPSCDHAGHPATAEGSTRLQAKRRRGTKVHATTLELRELRDEVQPIYIPSGFKGRRTKSGKQVTLNEMGRMSLRISLQNRLSIIEKLRRPTQAHKEEKQKIKKLLDWLATYDEWAEANKLLTTYTEFVPHSDSRVHTSFLIHGTRTGRLASKEPNLQNLPKQVREAFVADSGRVLVAADYSNLEVRIIALETGDVELWEYLEGGGNVHDLNTRLLFGIEPEDERWDQLRRVAKTFFFGRISYGGGDNEIYYRIITECPRAGITARKVKELSEEYFRTHPAYTEWYAAIQRDVYRTRRSETFSGRVRGLLGDHRDILKEALNTPIQGGAASIINQAMIRIENHEDDRGQMLLQVHDELLFEVIKPEVDSYVNNVILEEMQKPVNYKGKEVTFPVEVEVGHSWGTLEPWKETKNGKTNT